jgi:septal ring factor EnvC (AmiA/AmiB activator)
MTEADLLMTAYRMGYNEAKERAPGSIAELEARIADMPARSAQKIMAEQARDISELKAQLADVQKGRDALVAYIAELEAALERICDTDPDDGTAWFHEVARAALKGEK